MDKERFIEKYKGKTFFIERVKQRDLSTFTIEVDGHILTEDEEGLFFEFYQTREMRTISESPNTEIVDWI